MVERQLLKAQDRHGRRMEGQAAVKFGEGDAVWVYQYFRARRGERRTKKLAFSLHGPYRVVGQRFQAVGADYFRTKFRKACSRPLGLIIKGPSLTEEDLPPTSFVERLSIGGEETAFSGVSNPVVGVLAKRVYNREELYLVLTATYEVCWRPTATILPTYKVLVDSFEDERRKDLGLPELRRSARLAEANLAADDELLF
ncbi:hypothetical protein PF004_g15304 [Phytophthora fragariae]|uniref:Uncharacterized protein n=1 Tax=Phytophthora fragariae TaxID=53985 RepID=A0A6G0NLT7_9STRA|nr:hypothetical protein PF004_g15304 [Phytophthora fragariae]